MSPPTVVQAAGVGKTFWPQIIRVEKCNHPLHPSHLCLIVLLPSLADGLNASTQERVDELHEAAQAGAPSSSETCEIERLGWIVPAPGELVLARRADAPADGSQDTVIGLALDQSNLDQVVRNGSQTLKEVQHHLLGPRCSCNGTAAIEKCPETSRPGHQGPRCYTVGTSIETGTQRMAPAANISQGSTEHRNSYQETLSKVVTTLADLHSELIRSTLHSADATLLAARGDYLNAPALGSTRHHLVSGMQVNVTSVSGTQSLASHQALGSAAVFHTDNGDDFCALSALTNLSDVERDFALGFFFLLEYGVAFRWEPYLTVLASGRTLHVSSPPQLRPKCPARDPAPWELRLLVISYPSYGVLSRGCPTVLSSNGSTPVMVPPNLYTPATSSLCRSRRSWASDGGALMSRQNHLLFLTRELLSLSQHVLSQVPGLKFRINPQMFMSSFQVYDTQHNSANSGPDQEAWRPMTSENNCSSESGPQYSQSEFTSHTSSNLSDSIHRHRSNIPMLAAKQIGVVPRRSAQTASSTTAGVRTKVDPKQRTLVKNLLNQAKESAKRPLEADTDDGSCNLRRRKAATPDWVVDAESSSEGEDTYCDSDGDSFLHIDEITTDQASQAALKFAVTAVLRITNQASSAKLTRSFSIPLAKHSYCDVLELSAELLGTRNIGLLPDTQSNPAHAILRAPQFWEKIDTLQATVANQHFLEFRLTAAIMLATWRVWFWAESTFRLACASALVHMDEHSWVGKLARDVYEHVAYRRTTTFMRDKYLTLAPMPVKLTQRSYLSGFDALREANNIAVQLAWRRLSLEVFGMRGVATLSDTVWQELNVALRSLDLGSSTSPGSALLAANANICAKHPSPSKFPLPVLSQNDQDALSQGADGTNLEKKLADLWADFNPDTNTHSGSAAAPSVAPDKAVLDAVSDAAAKLKGFLTDFWMIQNTATPNSTWSRLQQSWHRKIIDHKRGKEAALDHYSSFRKTSPGRSYVTTIDGLFSPPFIRTPGGFFSALVFRGITDGSPKFLQRSHNNRFPELSNWLNAVSEAQSAGLTNEDICHPQAFGSPSSENVLANAHAYWRASSEKWIPFLQKHKVEASGTVSWELGITFLNCRTNRKQLFPGIGEKIACQLAVDLVYAGVFSGPSLPDGISNRCLVGKAVRNSLSTLGVLPKDVQSTVTDRQIAFKNLFKSITSLLSKEELLAYRWDIFVFEHALRNIAVVIVIVVTDSQQLYLRPTDSVWVMLSIPKLGSKSQPISGWMHLLHGQARRRVARKEQCRAWRVSAITADKFELVMGILERLTDERYPCLHALLRMLRVIYPHWHERRLEREGRRIIPQINFDETNEGDPHVCFRRRDVKPVRKTRRTDTGSIDRMQSLQNNLRQLQNIAQQVLRREQLKQARAMEERQVMNHQMQLAEVKRKFPTTPFGMYNDEEVLVDKIVKRPQPEGTNILCLP
ncbi:Enhancer of polycomb-like protein 1 [Ceratobasidium sp. 395]|nr:Enhancer of polycomb-like protein 1 [Ceratobasidium sp. 395]